MRWWSRQVGKLRVGFAACDLRGASACLAVLPILALFNGCGSDDPVQPPQTVDLAVDKSADSTTPTEGDDVVYTIVVSNAGPGNATGVRITDNLPSGTTYQSDATAQGTYDSATGIWDVGAVTSGASATLTLTARANEGTGGTMITNEAMVTSVTQTDSDASNDSDVAVINVQNHMLVLTPLKDNTLYEIAGEDRSNGAGEYMFAGRTAAATRRRCIMAFDLATLPANATVEAVELTLNMTQTSRPDPFNFVLHRLQADWGEGTSNAGGRSGDPGGGGGAAPTTGDATWQHRFYSGSFWNNMGGDYDSFEAATVAVGDLGTYTWSGNGLRSHVEGWLQNAASNFGWILIGNELTDRTAKRFDTRENIDGTGPRLVITYALP